MYWMRGTNENIRRISNRRVKNMNRQTEDYISLKPIADRFKDAANSITDDEIRNMIKNSLQRQIDE